jgi:hypothetical protein
MAWYPVKHRGNFPFYLTFRPFLSFLNIHSEKLNGWAYISDEVAKICKNYTKIKQTKYSIIQLIVF